MKTNAHSIDVLLATYNGETYLEEQIDSLFAQTCADFRVIARDDGSRDNTLAILNRYHQKYGDRFLVIDGETPTGSAKGNFAKLTAISDADYTMYCDQDDYWHPTKIEKTMSAMQKAERRYPSQPILVHGDLRVVNSERNIIANSFWRYQGLSGALRGVNSLIAQNVITGCTVMINRRLREKAQPFPKEMIMHDWWLGLVASATGTIVSLDEPLIDYRQHGSNDTGAKPYNLNYVVRRVLMQIQYERLSESRNTIHKTQAQAEALLGLIGKDLPSSLYALLERYVHLSGYGFVKRRYFVIRHGFMKQGFVRNLAYLAAI